MKKLLIVLCIYNLGLLSCSKTDVQEPLPLAEDNGCIERKILAANNHGVSAANVAEIDNVFLTANINHDRYRYYQYIHDSLQTQYPPYAKLDQKIIKVDEYTNGLRIFTGQIVFNFLNNLLSYRSGTGTNGTNLSRAPRLTIGQLRKLFIDHVEQFDHKGSQYKDTCLNAEFGYFNINSGISYTSEVLIKAWRVTRKNSVYPSEYPQAYYQDNDGKLIYYDNGFRTFR